MKKLLTVFLILSFVVFAADGFNTGTDYLSQDPAYSDLYLNPSNANFGFLLEFTGTYTTSSSLTYSDPFTLAPFDSEVQFAFIDTISADTTAGLADTVFTPKIAYSVQVHEGDDDNGFDNNPTFKIYGSFEPESGNATEVATLETPTDTTKNNGEVQIFVPVHYPYYFVTINASSRVDADAAITFETQLYPYYIDE